MSAEEIAGLRRLLEKATPGPWWIDGGGNVRCDEHHSEPNYVGITDFNGSDEALVVALRNAAPALLSLASFGAEAKAFLEKHANTADEAFQQSAAAWQKRLNDKEVGAHASARFALSQLLASARSLEATKEKA